MNTSERLDRLNTANQVLQIIGSHGNKLFTHQDRISKLEFDDLGRLWLVDAYSQKRIYIHYGGKWRGFTGGGTLRNLVAALREYVTRGTLVSPQHFGPWSERVGHKGDLWGYGEDMTIVRDKIKALNICQEKS